MYKKQFFTLFALFAFLLNIRANDSTMVLKLNTQAISMMIAQPEKAIEQLTQALQISKNCAFTKGTIITYKNLGLVYFQEKNLNVSLIYLKRAMQLAETSYNLTEIAQISNILGKVYTVMGDRENALFFLDKARKYNTVTMNTLGLHETMQTLSLVYQSENEYYQALHYGLEALKISSNFDNTEKMVLSLGNLAQIYSLLNQSQKALEHYLKAIRIAETGTSSDYLPILYLNTGTLYRDLKNWQQSINYFLKAYDIYKLTGNSDGMIAALSEIGQTYNSTNQYNKALNNFLRARTIAEQNRNFIRMISLNKEIADLYIKQKNFPKAIVYLDMNFNLAKELNDPKLEADAIMNLGFFHLVSGRYARAIELFQQSYAIASHMNDLKLLTQITDYLSTAYAKSAQFENAYKYLKISKKYSDSHFSSVEHITFQKLQSVFEITNTEKNLEILRKSNELERLEKQKAIAGKNKLYLTIGFLLFLLAVLVYLFIRLRNANSVLRVKSFEIEASNQALLTMNVNLEMQKTQLNSLNKSLVEANKMLQESEERYKAICSTKDKLFSVISHDLRSPFSSVVSFVRILKRDMKKLTKLEIVELTDELEDTTERINTLLENLLQWSLLQRGKITYHPESMNLFELANESAELFRGIARNKKVRIVNNLSENINTIADKHMISTVIRNLLSNAIKFTFQDTEVIISDELIEEHKLIIKVTDSGKGLEPDQIHSIMSGSYPTVRKGTNNESGSGLGLLICHDFLQFHQTALKAELRKKHQGSVFSFLLDIDTSML